MCSRLHGRRALRHSPPPLPAHHLLHVQRELRHTGRCLWRCLLQAHGPCEAGGQRRLALLPQPQAQLPQLTAEGPEPQLQRGARQVLVEPHRRGWKRLARLSRGQWPRLAPRGSHRRCFNQRGLPLCAVKYWKRAQQGSTGLDRAENPWNIIVFRPISDAFGACRGPSGLETSLHNAAVQMRVTGGAFTKT